jgi:hypothetical protein
VQFSSTLPSRPIFGLNRIIGPRVLVKMETDLKTNHAENSGTPAVIHDSQIYSDVDLRKAGVNDNKEDNVANTHLV